MMIDVLKKPLIVATVRSRKISKSTFFVFVIGQMIHGCQVHNDQNRCCYLLCTYVGASIGTGGNRCQRINSPKIQTQNSIPNVIQPPPNHTNPNSKFIIIYFRSILSILQSSYYY
jgi:hypothetical protein